MHPDRVKSDEIFYGTAMILTVVLEKGEVRLSSLYFKFQKVNENNEKNKEFLVSAQKLKDENSIVLFLLEVVRN